MPPLLQNLPKKIIIACSGGPDSMAAVAFALAGKREVELAYFNHGTEYAPMAEDFVKFFADRNGLAVHTERLDAEKKPGQSKEEFWRNERYKWLHSLNGTVITAHHLDDTVETWLFTSFRGYPSLIPSERNPNVIRPFLLWKKEELRSFLDKRKIGYIDDPSNEDLHYSRNRIRHNIIPEILKINPGIHTTVRNLLLKREKENGNG